MIGGVAWPLVKNSVKKNNTIENIEKIFKFSQKNNIHVFISPHYYYPGDNNWKFKGVLEKKMHKLKMFSVPKNKNIIEYSGADWLDRYKKYIYNNKNIVVTSPHKIYGPETNDLVLQLRKRGITKVYLGGMSANLCVESHMRELIEQGFDVSVINDATAAATLNGMDGYQAANINYNFIATSVLKVDDIEKHVK